MKIALVQLRLLLAVILLIAGGAFAGLPGQVFAMGKGVAVTADVATLSTSASHKVMGHLASTDQDNHRAPCDNCLGCIHSCCAAGLSAGKCGALRDAPRAIRFVAEKAFLARGVYPEALLQPPQIYA